MKTNRKTTTTNTNKTDEKILKAAAQIANRVKPVESKKAPAKKVEAAKPAAPAKAVEEVKPAAPAKAAEEVKPAKPAAQAKAAEAAKPVAEEKKAPAKKAAAKPAEEKKAPAKKAAAKPAEEKKAPAKKPAAKKTTAKESLFLQYMGREIDSQEMVDKVKEAWTSAGNLVKDIKTMELYVKPEENKIYYVINKDVSGSVDL